MESDDHDDQPTSEKLITDGDEQGSSKVTPRSYECNFCKRGFSNAQALGGHMNIHRKDKAKLKQQSSSNQTQPSLEGKPGKEPSNNPNWPWNVSQSREETHVVHKRQLPLFAESPDRWETQQPEGQIHEEISTEGGFSSDQGSSSELDLELRLGPEPQDSSSAAMGTRKFL